MFQSRRKRDSPISTPQAPRSQRIPLPDVGEGDLPKDPQPHTPALPLTTKGHRRRLPSVDEGYGTSPEASTSTRRPSDAARTPRVPTKGILKHVETPPVYVSRVETDGYASSPEKSSRTHYATPRGESSRMTSRSHPTPSVTPPVSLHWSLLPYDHHISKSRLVFDTTLPIEHIAFMNTWPPRPLSSTERNKPAANPPLKEMVIRCKELPEWPVYVAHQGGIRCIDVWEAIKETFLTSSSPTPNADSTRVCPGRSTCILPALSEPPPGRQTGVDAQTRPPGGQC
ncbi:hypothetical protein EW146_g6710, partial [Bondarzewia mesenterica]